MSSEIILVEDTRNQIGRHQAKNDYFTRKGVKVIRSKLYAGDYSLLHNQSICIDTKENLGEWAGNIVHDHARVAAEADRAYENGIRLIFLIENNEGIRSIDDIAKWSNSRWKRWKKQKPNQRPPISSEQLAKATQTFAKHHHCVFAFTSVENAGRAVLYLLTGKDFGS